MPGLTVICPNAKRCFVETSATTVLRQILEEACMREGFDFDKYVLLHKDRVLDLSLPYRLSSLSNHACIEMKAASSDSSSDNIEIALQISDGTRKSRKFPSDSTLLELLEKFSIDFGKDLLDCTLGKVPCCGFMGRLFRGVKELSHYTLKSAGVNKGRMLIRYSEINMSEEEQKMVEDRLIQDEVKNKKWAKDFHSKKAENERGKIHEQEPISCVDTKTDETTQLLPVQSSPILLPPTQSLPVQSSPILLPPTQSLPVQSSPILLPPTQSLPVQSSPILLPPTQSITDSAAVNSESKPSASPLSNDFNHTNSQVDKIDVCKGMFDRKPVSFIPDESRSVLGDESDADFFDLTVKDVSALQRSLKNQKKLDEMPLGFRAFAAKRNKEEKQNVFKHTVVRFQLCEAVLIQGLFVSAEPVSSLFSFISEICSIKTTDFVLKLFLNVKLNCTSNESLIDCDVAPKSRIHVKLIDGDIPISRLTGSIREVTHAEADSISSEWLSANQRFRSFESAVITAHKRVGDREDLKKLHTSHLVIPKWYRK